ncbi:hypothetical protein F2Q70_00016338 [Brassica cretica]|uniref:Uncharacterized protein n=1 Tax=Brassica cretica TaxID=69181 RepID=A0A8S9L4H9_BRACR|nr:hypothetical protein F2Q70_00016338 [Brassica cretica]KAF2601062.1 hypothetical protein F2Q68_00009308 [Brassica cretica]
MLTATTVQSDVKDKVFIQGFSFEAVVIQVPQELQGSIDISWINSGEEESVDL